MKKNIETAAIEITTFKLKGHSMAAFAKANANIDEWLKKQPGFKSRHMAEGNDGSVMDMLIWDSVEQGTDAMHRIISETSESKVHEMIDHGTVEWSCVPVFHQMLNGRR